MGQCSREPCSRGFSPAEQGVSVTSSPILSSDDAQLVRPGDPIDRGATADELIKSCRDCLENLLHDDVSFHELRNACKVEFDTLLQEGSYDVHAMNFTSSIPSKVVSLGIAESLLKRSCVDDSNSANLIVAPLSDEHFGVVGERGGPEAQPSIVKRPLEKPSLAEIKRHNATHLPFRSWCPICVAARPR